MGSLRAVQIASLLESPLALAQSFGARHGLHFEPAMRHMIT